ncbi:MAG: hypothetical protein LBF58_06365 [Deltaproteobacteria bacterium]|jgi:predicted transposase/invertase (TIGR01784 family)|nr:hypothetical protein [Deltaproteobacteria bacterium]
MKKMKPIEYPNQDFLIMLFRDMGIGQGIEDGIKQGRKEGGFEIARKMLAEGVPAKTISKWTDLDEETILSLKKSMA